MRRMRKLRLRFRSLFNGSHIEDDLDDELRDYLQREAEREIAAGASPEEARRRALSTLHGLERVKEECRDTWGVRWWEDTISDVRFALRTLRKSPAFAVTVIAALAFCIGANTAIFSIVDAVLFRPLPFPDQGRLVSLTEGIPSMGFPVIPFACPDYLFVAVHNRSFASTGAYHPESYEMSGMGQPQRVEGTRMTASLFQVLGIKPLLGRTFTQTEDENAKQVAVLNYGLAGSLFGVPERALGRTIHLDRKPYTVIGVMPSSFSFPLRGAMFDNGPAKVFIPISWSKTDREEVLNNFDYRMLARLRPHVTVSQAGAELNWLLKRISASYPASVVELLRKQTLNFSLTSQVTLLREEVTGRARNPLLLLLASAGLLLLIGCADIANLMFSRMVGRQREFALRSALGANKARLVRQTLTEGLVLSGAGGVIGFCLAFWVLPFLLRFAPDNLPRLNEVGLDWRTAAFVAAVSLAPPLFFCLAPFVHTIYSAISHPLRGEGRANTLNKQGRFLMSGAVVVQFSLTFLLLITASLLMRSFLKASEADPGFRPEHLISTQIALPSTIYKQSAQITNFYNQLLARLSALLGVWQAGAVSSLPMYSSSNRILFVEGHSKGFGEIDTVFCIGNALQSLGVQLLRGRLLQSGDELGTQRSAVLSETLAKQVWPNENPLGRHFKFGNDPKDPWITVVGVVADIKNQLTSHAPRRLVLTTSEDWVREMNVLVRASGDARFLMGAIRSQVKQLDSSLPLEKIETVDQVLSKSLSAERFRTWLLASFAAIALLLATLGIAGLLAYNTSQRKQEFGVRIALGAERRDLLALVLKHGLRLCGAGIAVGTLASLVVIRALSALLYDTSPYDLPTFVAVPSILVLVALAASLFPAWRAARTDPMSALKAE